MRVSVGVCVGVGVTVGVWVGVTVIAITRFQGPKTYIQTVSCNFNVPDSIIQFPLLRVYANKTSDDYKQCDCNDQYYNDSDNNSSHSVTSHCWQSNFVLGELCLLYFAGLTCPRVR